MLRPTEYLAAAAPTAVGVTLAQVNEMLGCVSLALGIAYLVWRWRREASRET